MPREIERAFAIALKEEASPGTDAVPTMAANALRVAEPVLVEDSFLSMNEASGEQTGGKGTFESSARAGRSNAFTVKRRLRGVSGAFANPANLPKEDALWRAILGTRNFIVGPPELVEYTGADQDEKTLTVIAQTSKKQFKALAVVPRSASLELAAGGVLMLTTELVGVGQAPAQQLLEAPTLDTVIPPVAKGITFSLGGTALKLISFNLDFGLAVSEPILDGTAGDAWSGHVLTDRMPNGTLTINVEDTATFNPYLQCANSAQLALVLQAGATQYNRVRVEADKLEITGVKLVSRGGVMAYECTFKINRATGPSLKDPLIQYL
ncbi:MAG: phage tail tube protein [Longimicrobiales bacterium]